MRSLVHKCFLNTLPVMAGYVVLGTGFGMLLHEKGYGFLWAAAMSIFIYAGSMQYLAVDLLTGGNRQTPPYITYLSKVLPFAIMGMLVVYCLRNITFDSMPFGIPELIGCAVVAGLHLWKRNTLLSITGGTVCYMLLIQLVF